MSGRLIVSHTYRGPPPMARCMKLEHASLATHLRDGVAPLDDGHDGALLNG